MRLTATKEADSTVGGQFFLKGYGCKENNSLWCRVYFSKTKKQWLKNARKMIKILRSLLFS